MSQQQREVSDAIFCMAMRLTDKGEKADLVEKIVRSACQAGGVSYPPQQMEAVCQSQL